MAKVFATVLEKGNVLLKTWPSAKSFNKTESWLDPKFIYVATSDDFKGKNSFPYNPLFDEKISLSDNSLIIRTIHDVNAHNIMYSARNNHLRIL
jgi:hypothetical protein